MKLHRSTSDRMISGVAGGIAEELNVDSTLVRLITAAIVIFTGVGPILYILAWILMPEANGHVIAQDAADWVGKQAKGKGKGQSGPGAGQPYPDPNANQNIHNPHDLR